MLYTWGVMNGLVDPTHGGIFVDPIAVTMFDQLKKILFDPLLLIRMQTTVFPKATDVSDAYGAIFDELIHGNYVYIVFKHYATWHAVVAYDGDDDGLFVMDPFYGYSTYVKSKLAAPLLIATKRRGMGL